MNPSDVTQMGGFPSPCGEKVGINTALGLVKRGGGLVSVPLRGKGRDQPTITVFEKYSKKKFPSPCGEKVGINGDPSKAQWSLKQLKFPSPCGEKVGINPFYF